MSARSQLEWTARNRKRASRATSAGLLLARLAGRVEQATGRVEKVEAVLDVCMEDEFRRRCRPVRLHRGVLHVHVRRPEWLCETRLRWQQRLLDVLGRQARGLGVRRIEFASDGPVAKREP